MFTIPRIIPEFYVVAEVIFNLGETLFTDTEWHCYKGII